MHNDSRTSGHESPELDTETTSQSPDDKQQTASELRSEIDEWHAKIDAAKLRMHLGARDAHDALRPQIDRLEQELSQLTQDWHELERASEGAWSDVQHGLKLSLKAMQRSFDRAQQRFETEGGHHSSESEPKDTS